MTFPARPTFASGAGPAPVFNTPPSFSGTSSQVLPEAAHLPGRAPPQTLGSAFSPLSLESAFVYTTSSAPTSRPAVVQSVIGLLLPPVKLGALISPEASTPASAKRAPQSANVSTRKTQRRKASQQPDESCRYAREKKTSPDCSEPSEEKHALQLSSPVSQTARAASQEFVIASSNGSSDLSDVEPTASCSKPRRSHAPPRSKV